MNFLQSMNEAIGYIEDHLDGEISLKKAAEKSGYSEFYFQRVFSCISGISIAEYIRRRKMTLAAFELQNSDLRIIDIAVKYGYESADSFTRAFQALHGIKPSAARQKGMPLKSFPPMSFYMSMKGDKEMNYRIEKKDKIRIVGIMRHFKAPEHSEKDVPVFWDEVYQNGTYEKILRLSTGVPEGVHGFIHVIDDKTVDYMIAAVSEQPVPEGMEEYIVPASTWAVFETVGPVGSAMEVLWKRIFEEWLPSSNYKHANTMEIECFRNQGDRSLADFQFEIWIPVEIK